MVNNWKESEPEMMISMQSRIQQQQKFSGLALGSNGSLLYSGDP